MSKIYIILSDGDGGSTHPPLVHGACADKNEAENRANDLNQHAEPCDDCGHMDYFYVMEAQYHGNA